jgi:hypothetical protein
MGLRAWLFGPRRVVSPAPGAGEVEEDVLANLTTGEVDIQWSSGGSYLMGVRMNELRARQFAAKIVRAADALGAAVDVDLSAEELEDGDG